MIIAAVPRTPRSGRSDRRSMTTPIMPAAVIVTTNAKPSDPANANPVRTWLCPEMPSNCNAHMPIKDATIKTLKWAKLISSRMP